MNIFFTADQHFYHYNIIRHCQRPFSSVAEMNKTIIDNWNSVVNKNDLVYVLGDFCWRGKPSQVNQMLLDLNGNKYLVKGNHDSKQVHKSHFIWVRDLDTIRIGQDRIVLCHYPLRSWSSKSHGTYHLHGHCHGNLKSPIKNSLDVGVDSNNFTPVNWEVLKKRLDEQKGDLYD